MYQIFLKGKNYMKKIDPVIIKETVYISVFSLILSLLMQSVFLIIGKWDYTVLLGNLLGYVAAVGNFFLMGLTVQSSLKMEEKDAKMKIRLSQGLRFLGLIVIAIVGWLVPVFNIIAVVIPYLFPRIGVAVRPLFKKF